MTTAVTSKAALKAEEEIIGRGIHTAFEVGQALARVRDQKLYAADGYSRFEDYCQSRWTFTASRARQLIGSAEVLEDVKSVTNVTPSNESQTRALKKLPREARAEVWKEAAEESERTGKPVTGKTVEQVVARRIEPQEFKEDLEPAPAVTRRKNGAEVFPVKEKKKVLKLIGELIRLLDKTPVWTSAQVHANALVEIVEKGR